jgi:hypothetical protein
MLNLGIWIYCLQPPHVIFGTKHTCVYIYIYLGNVWSKLQKKCMYVCMCIYKYIYTHTHTHTLRKCMVQPAKKKYIYIYSYICIWCYVLSFYHFWFHKLMFIKIPGTNNFKFLSSCWTGMWRLPEVWGLIAKKYMNRVHKRCLPLVQAK